MKPAGTSNVTSSRPTKAGHLIQVHAQEALGGFRTGALTHTHNVPPGTTGKLPFLQAGVLPSRLNTVTPLPLSHYFFWLKGTISVNWSCSWSRYLLDTL